MTAVTPDWGPIVGFIPDDDEFTAAEHGRHYRPDAVAVIPGLDSDALLEVVYQGEKLKLAREIYGEDTIFPQHRPEGAGVKVTVTALIGGFR